MAPCPAKVIVFTLAAFGANVLFAGPEPCKTEPNDPFAVEQRMPAGPYRGGCIDLRSDRSVDWVYNKDLRRFGIDSKNSLVVANFRHANRFWIAVIPFERVVGLSYLNFSMAKKLPISHGEIRFLTRKTGRPIELIEQNLSKEPERMNLNEDFVFAEYAVRAQGHYEDFNVVHGMRGHYAVSYIFMSLSQSASGPLASKITIKQYSLAALHSQSKLVMEIGLWLGHTYKMTQVYHSFTTSCLNSVFSVLLRARRIPTTGTFNKTLESFMPIPMLRKFRLIGPGESSRMKNLNDEPNLFPKKT